MPEPDVARAFWVAGPGRGELRALVLRAAGPGEVRVQALASGVSRGTESLVFLGRVPASQREAMRCPFQDGEFPGPVKYGYASVGRVLDGPAELAGRRVFCLHPHQDRYVVPASAVVPVPASVPDARAVLAANLETAINGLWDAAPRVGDRLAGVGAGVVGALLGALAARIPGTRVEFVDPDPRREALARRLGCRWAPPARAHGDADLVVHASGDPDGLATALALAGFESTVLEMSWYGDRPVPAPLGEAFHSKRLTLRASQVGAVAPARRARWTHGRRLGLALDLLADPIFDALLDGSVAFDALPQAMARLAHDPDAALCRVVTYP